MARRFSNHWNVLLLLALPAAGRVFDVAPGADLNAALAEVRAWRSAGAPHQEAVLRLAAGTYELAAPLQLTAADHHLVLEAAAPGAVTLSGGTRVDGWTEASNGLWRLDLPADLPGPEQLYGAGGRLPRAREPDGDFFTLESAAQLTNTAGRVELMLGLPPPAAALDPAAGGVIQVFHKWDTTRGPVLGFDAASRVVRLAGHTMKSWNPLQKGRRFFIENVPAACDEAGEWFTAGRAVYARGRPGPVTVPRLERLVEARGASNVTFRGLVFAHTAYRMPADGDAPAQAASFVSAAVELSDAARVTLEDCAIEHTGGYALWFRAGSTDGAARRCLFRDLGAGGVRIGETKISERPAQRIVLAESRVETIGRVHPSAVGVWIGQSPNNVVRGCEIRDTYYSGFSVGWTWGYGPHAATNNLIEGNYVHQIGQGALCDMGGIYTLGVSPGTRITGNYFADIEGWEYGGWGLYTDEGSTGIEMSSNVVVRTSCRVRAAGGGGFHQHYGSTNLIAHNFLADAGGAQVQASRVEDHLSFILRGNTIVNPAAPAVGCTWNAEGPWAKIRVRSEGNRFFCGVTNGYAGRTFAAWQALVKDEGSTVLEAAPALPPPPVLRTGPAWR